LDFIPPFPVFLSLDQFTLPLIKNLLLSAIQLIQWSDIANSTMKPFDMAMSPKPVIRLPWQSKEVLAE
jgi:hypothetical protein